ncbi:polyprenyl synthetase family protein [Porticoccaceae bacterium]|nr:polyprenyl synthetase family protein [Porticoccaceae bacterium]
MADLRSFLLECSQLVEAQLAVRLPAEQGPASRLFAAVRYSALGGGKRLRPALAIATSDALGGQRHVALGVAAAVEMIHVYSLIHDDLPAMDDDALRRGKATCHIAFDEATAILAGDGLQALAFLQLAELEGVAPATVVKLIAQLAKWAGCDGMVAGQAIDIAATGQQLNLDQLKQMHRLKTGALMEASVMLAAQASGNASKQQLLALQNFSQTLGLAFQIQDDLLDIESDTAQLGKPQGSDIASGKVTYPQLLGVEEARQAAHQAHSKALASLESFDQRADPLRALANFVVTRNY